MLTLKTGKAFFKAYSKDESGATAIEYGLIVAIIAIGGIFAFQNLSNVMSGQFNDIATAMDNAVTKNVKEANSSKGTK